MPAKLVDLKNAFDISVPDDQEYASLVIYMNEETLAFIDYSKDPFRAGGIRVYQFGQQAKSEEWVNGIRQAIQLNDGLLERYGNAYIFLDFQDTILAPSEMDLALSTEQMMYLAYGEKPDQRIMNEPEQESGIRIIHQAPGAIVDALEKYFPGTPITHANGCFLLNKEQGAILQVVVFAHSLKTTLHKDGVLQFIGRIEYQTSTDAVYHLLNLCRNYNVDPSSVRLLLNGLIDSQSILYEDIYRYFLHVQFDNAEPAVLSTSLAEYPAHFFNYFIRLALCAS